MFDCVFECFSVYTLWFVVYTSVCLCLTPVCCVFLCSKYDGASMGRINVTTYEEHDEVLEDISGETEAEKVRRCIEAYPRLEELESELKHKENKIEELRNQLISANSRIDASNQLVKRVDEQDEEIAQTLAGVEEHLDRLEQKVEEDGDRGMLGRLLGR